MPRAIALLRVSTDVQDVARQRTDIERLRRKYDLGIIRTLELVGVSGTGVLDNAQHRQVLADLPQVDGVAVSALDRLFRVKHFKDMGILDQFKDLRKAIWSVREGLVEPWTDEGYDKCFLAAGRGGSEVRELLRRSIETKRESFDPRANMSTVMHPCRAAWPMTRRRRHGATWSRIARA